MNRSYHLKMYKQKTCQFEGLDIKPSPEEENTAQDRISTDWEDPLNPGLGGKSTQDERASPGPRRWRGSGRARSFGLWLEAASLLPRAETARDSVLLPFSISWAQIFFFSCSSCTPAVLSNLTSQSTWPSGRCVIALHSHFYNWIHA